MFACADMRRAGVFACADMIPERNALMEHVYPKLKKVCREKFQLEFQVYIRTLELFKKKSYNLYHHNILIL